MFHAEKAKYDEFLEVMKNFKAQRNSFCSIKHFSPTFSTIRNYSKLGSQRTFPKENPWAVAQRHADVSVSRIAAAVAALTAAHASAIENGSTDNPTKAAPLRMSAAIASAAALVASHCIEIAEEMGANHHQILNVVDSAVNARRNGDIMSLTAGAATALRGASTLKARLQNGNCAAALAIADEEGKELSMGTAMNFISRGGELLKRTRKGDLHRKQVSFRVNPALQVVVKLKSSHVGGTFTKKKKFVVAGVYPEIPAWPGREKQDYDMQKEYFGIQIADRIIEFECKNKAERQIWTDGIQHMCIQKSGTISTWKDP